MAILRFDGGRHGDKLVRGDEFGNKPNGIDLFPRALFQISNVYIVCNSQVRKAEEKRQVDRQPRCGSYVSWTSRSIVGYTGDQRNSRGCLWVVLGDLGG